MFENTSNSTISKLEKTSSVTIERYGLKSYISLFIRIQHPSEFQLKMTIPTYGPIVFILIIGLAQFVILRMKMNRGDHLRMYLATALFALGTSFTVREMTPPELTWPELLLFLIAIMYSLVLIVIIYRGHHKKTKELREICKEIIAELSKEMEFPDSLDDENLENLKKGSN